MNDVKRSICCCCCRLKKLPTLVALIGAAIVTVGMAQLKLVWEMATNSAAVNLPMDFSKDFLHPSGGRLSSSSSTTRNHSDNTTSLAEEVSLLLESYNPFRSPVFPSTNGKTSREVVIKVGIVTISPLVGEAMHFLYDGVQGSNYLNLVGVVSLFDGTTTTNNNNYNFTKTQEGTANDARVETFSIGQKHRPQDVDIWIVDGARVAKLQRAFLHDLLQTPNASWQVLIVDYTDRFSFQLRLYHKLQIWDQPHVRLAVRSIVQGRHYIAENQTMVRGRIAPNMATAGGPTLHVPYAVRSDTVESIQDHIHHGNSSSPFHSPRLLLDQMDSVVNLDRPIDVLHLWNVSFKEGKSKLRNDVSKLVRKLNGATSRKLNRTIVTSIQEQGQRRQVGRNTIDPSYTQALLSAKIVIVTQKDDWEDHYRLFESVVAGAMVIHDAMSAPPKGMIHGETIVFFETLLELEHWIWHYLENEDQRVDIARKGWKMAMGRHRSWHRMEELLFGLPLTDAAPEFTIE